MTFPLLDACHAIDLAQTLGNSRDFAEAEFAEARVLVEFTQRSERGRVETPKQHPHLTALSGLKSEPPYIGCYGESFVR